MSKATAAEFERQLDKLVERGYPRAGGLSAAAFRRRLEPLREVASGLEDLPPRSEPEGAPFVVVVNGDLLSAAQAIALVERRDKAGFSVLDPDDLERFEPIETVELPGGSAYLIVDVDTGQDTRNVTPEDALERIESGGRSPLTVEEGITLITQRPEAVARNAGFSLPGSRCGDRRVTALWISNGRPKLGWCWAGNPHTWLGSASCARRVGVNG
jgi:Family of unknown function (DUF5701)